MAAEGSGVTLEPVVNRWIVDFYSFVALEFFKNDRYADFCAVRDILDSILGRPLESTDDMALKVRVLQFLSRVNEGENLDLRFDYNQSVTPLESALNLLESMNCEFSIPHEEFERVCALVKEMIVGIFIKNNEFDKAMDVLNKQFPKAMGGKKAVFMGLISGKIKTHEVIKQINFQQFKKEILAFCQRLCSFSVPFLQKAAKKIVDHRLAEQDDGASEVSEQDEPGPSSGPQMNIVRLRPCKHLIIPRARLEAAYKALASGFGGITFSQLEQEVETECQEKEDICEHPSADHNRSTNLCLEHEGLFQRDVCSPMEASPADHPTQMDVGPQTQAGSLSKKLYTVARLVIEPDSQPSSQCTAAPEELETDVRTEEAPQTPTVSSKNDPKEMQCPITERECTIPVRKCPRRTKKTTTGASTSVADSSEGSEDSPLDPVANRKRHVGDLHNQSNRSLGNPRDEGGVSIIDSSLDTSPTLRSPCHSVPQKSSTPHKGSAQEMCSAHSKWKTLYNNAKEDKATWSDEELYFPSKKSINSNESTVSNSGHRKRKWTDSETQMLKDGVDKFGEGNWNKIKAYYAFKDRTNVNLKDRWRTLKKLNMV
ncbi:telomeric repeat binding factor a [Xenentodon cancila]